MAILLGESSENSKVCGTATLLARFMWVGGLDFATFGDLVRMGRGRKTSHSFHTTWQMISTSNEHQDHNHSNEAAAKAFIAVVQNIFRILLYCGLSLSLRPAAASFPGLAEFPQVRGLFPAVNRSILVAPPNYWPNPAPHICCRRITASATTNG